MIQNQSTRGCKRSTRGCKTGLVAGKKREGHFFKVLPVSFKLYEHHRSYATACCCFFCVNRETTIRVRKLSGMEIMPGLFSGSSARSAGRP